MNQVYVCGTYFMIYVSMLKTLYQKDKSTKSLLILNDHTPGIEKIIPALKENGFFDHYLFVPFREIEDRIKKEKGLLGKFINRNKNVIDYVEQNSGINRFDDFIQYSEFNLFYLWGLPSAYFILKYPNNFSRIIEDGTRNYLLKTSAFKHFKRKHILRTFIGDGFDEAVREIHVQYPDKLDHRLRHKGVTLELKSMQANLSAEQNARILNVFMHDHSIDLAGSNKLILITQPLSEDGYISEDYKLKLYTDIIEQHGQQYQVYLKPHPRELTNYKERLSHAFIEIPRSFPLEMFDLMKNISFDKGVTLYSSSLANLQCIVDKIHLGKEPIRELLPGQRI